MKNIYQLQFINQDADNFNFYYVTDYILSDANNTNLLTNFIRTNENVTKEYIIQILNSIFQNKKYETSKGRYMINVNNDDITIKYLKNGIRINIKITFQRYEDIIKHPISTQTIYDPRINKDIAISVFKNMNLAEDILNTCNLKKYAKMTIFGIY